MKKSKRYMVSIGAGIILASLAGIAIFKNMEGVASACVAGIMAILSSYIWGETKRPSNRQQENFTDFKKI